MQRISRMVVGVTIIAIAGMTAFAVVPKMRRANAIHPVTHEPIMLPGKDGDATLLHSGWRVSPVGNLVKTNDMLLGGAFSPDGKTFAIASCGYTGNVLNLIRVADESVLQQIPLGRAWNGIAWSEDGNKLYVSGGNSTGLADVNVIEKQPDGTFAKGAAIVLPTAEKAKTCTAGLALSKDGKTLFAVNHIDGCLYAIDLATGGLTSKTTLGDHPLACKLSADGNTLYVTNLGGAEVVAVDVAKPDSVAVVARMETGGNPNDIVLSRDGRAFVSCGTSDVVTVIDLVKRHNMETVSTALTLKSALGATPNALALSADQHTLYVANADTNNVAVVDIEKPGKTRVKGFIPTGWYPTSVHCTSDGKKLLIGSGKGAGIGPNMAALPIPKDRTGGFKHIGFQLNGSVAFITPPDERELEQFTRKVVENTPYSDSFLKSAPYPERTAIPTRVGGRSPIKYVFYIIKENRTYDQVFGDMPRGNGDPNLTLFGRDVTPNHHKLAEEFVLLDNLYCNGEVSADGHPWSVSAYATEHTQRFWVMSYSGKGARDTSEKVDNPKSGFIWEACLRKGLSIRTYGEYAFHSSLKNYQSEAWLQKLPGENTRGRDTNKADIFIKEFKEYEKAGKVPRFTIMSLGEDHTDGTRTGSFAPKSCVASNDYALGKIVETISKSKIWKESAIFVIEDDAQNGPDHVDAHRTIGLVISPYTKRGILDSTMYQTTSMLRTMELILGLPPLTVHDAAATPMFASFTDKPDLKPYDALAPSIDTNVKNMATAYGASISNKMDFSEYDRIDEQALNRILWHSIRGKDAKMPPIVRRAILTPGGRVMASSAEEEEEENEGERKRERGKDRD